MAQIDVENFDRLDKQRNILHDKVYATYTTFDSSNKHYLQIDTYGRSNRNCPGKISQSIQLDKNSAILLYNLLKKEFDL